MSKAADIVGLQKQHGQYRKQVGYWDGRDGRRVQKVWQLGTDFKAAVTKAMLAVATWRRIKAAGRRVWSESDIAIVEEATSWPLLPHKRYTAKELHDLGNRPVVAVLEINGQKVRGDEVVDDSASTTPPKTPTVPMLHAWLEKYDAFQLGQPTSLCYRRRTSDVIVRLKKDFLDCPLSEVDFAYLGKLTNFYKGRPKSKSGKPLRPHTVKTMLHHARRAFDWIDSASNGAWQMQRKSEKLFTVKMGQLQTALEKRNEADGPRQLTMTEIRKLYHAAPDSLRLFMLLGITCGLGQSELAAVGKTEFDLEAATLTHRRHKTGVKGVFWLCPEVVKLLADRLPKTPENTNELAFLTDEGLPLVSPGSDSVRRAWYEVRKVGGVEWAGFYACRHFLGWWMRRHYSKDMMETALAHAAQGQGERHYSGTQARDYEALHAAQKALHAELTAAGVFAVGETKAMGKETAAA